MISAKLMSVDPAGVIHIVFMDKSDPQGVGRGDYFLSGIRRSLRDHAGKCVLDSLSGNFRRGLRRACACGKPCRRPGHSSGEMSCPGHTGCPGLFHKADRFFHRMFLPDRLRVCPVLDQCNLSGPGSGKKLFSEQGQTPFDLLSVLAQKTVEAVNTQIDQKCVGRGLDKLSAGPRRMDRISRAEGDKCCVQFFKQFFRPWLLEILSQDLRQPGVTPRCREGDLEHARDIEKIQEFIIDSALDRIVPGRKDPDHLRGD